MHEAALRTVLLIRSIDEGDKSGEVLSLAERKEATQAAAQGVNAIPNVGAGTGLPGPAERVLVRRAELLFAKLETRAPVIAQLVDLAAGASWLGPAVLALAVLAGVIMSALDGSHRIDILAFPLLGLIAWNLIVYATRIAVALRSRRARERQARSSWLSSAYAHWIRGRAEALLRRSARFNVPLSDALQRFSLEWAAVSRPTLLLRAERLFHLGAACLALGLVAGLYTRGTVLRYDAGWESTFLDASEVRGVIGLVYGPASALSRIALPETAQLETLRWTSDGGGGPAADWIHLIAITALLYVVLPRVLLAVLTSVALWRAARVPLLPDAFFPYARSILLETGRVSLPTANVFSYAYEPSPDALAGLRALLSDALGGQVKLEMRVSIPYGEEDAASSRLRREELSADCQVLLMSLAATPEAENHGAMIKATQRALRRRAASLLLLVDESAYASRLGRDPALANRLAERAQAWRSFAAQHGQPACVIVDLSRLRPGDTPGASTTKDVREVLARTVGA